MHSLLKRGGKAKMTTINDGNCVGSYDRKVIDN